MMLPKRLYYTSYCSDMQITLEFAIIDLWAGGLAIFIHRHQSDHCFVLGL